MTKIFKHHKPNIQAEYDPAMFFGAGGYVVRFGDKRSGKYLEADEQELLALGFEEIKDNHFGNGMIEPKHDICYIIATEYQYGHDNRVEEIITNKNCWSLFQTKEQAKQFDKMMMTVWKIWKWKKENDTEGGSYGLVYDKERKEFGNFFSDRRYGYCFFLPPFSSRNKVNQLISDLGEEELNNLLCWIK